MNPIRAFWRIHTGLRKAQAAYRRRHGKEPTVLPWELNDKEDAMDKILGLIPKGKGTKFTGGLGILVAIAALAGQATGHPIPGISMETGTALGTIWVALLALFVRRAATPAK